MENQEFAAKLLFWLLPWPISSVLPRALRIYYWGPSGIPPPGYEYGDEPPLGLEFNPFDPLPGAEDPPDPTPPPGPGWLTIFDDTYWDPVSNVTWTGTSWRATGGTDSRLVPKGSWAYQFRPDLLEITYTDDITAVRLADASNNKLAFAYSDPGHFNAYFPWVNDYDIAMFRIFFTGHGFNITNLRFLAT